MLTDPMASEVIYSFFLQVVLAGALGLMASHFWLHQRQENGLHATVTDPCEDLIEKAKLSERFKLGTKTPYQFEAAVTDDSFMHGCPAVQVSCCHPNELVRAPVFVSPLMYTMVADVEEDRRERETGWYVPKPSPPPVFGHFQALKVNPWEQGVYGHLILRLAIERFHVTSSPSRL